MTLSKTWSIGLTLLVLHIAGQAQNYARQDEKSGLYGIADAEDKYIVKPIYKEVDFNFGYKPGLSYVINKNGKYGFINAEGKEVVPCKYDRAGSFDHGYSIIEIKTGEFDALHGMIDSTGKEVIPVKYGRLEFYASDKVLVVGETNTSNVGLMDLSGKMLIPYQYEFWSKRISNGLWPVGKDNICGVVNLKNEIIVPFSYYMIESYSDELGLAPARKDQGGKYGFIDRTGKVVIPFEYEDAWPSGDYLVVKKGGKWGIIDASNKVILPFEYYSVSSAGKKTAWVAKTENESVYEIDLTTKQKVGK
ncbi:MAG: WG repeat-containing protein [Bacteroidetes bacterium]|nr:WG repeat-containing protein [Bacteroidota bacterium]